MTVLFLIDVGVGIAGGVQNEQVHSIHRTAIIILHIILEYSAVQFCTICTLLVTLIAY